MYQRSLLFPSGAGKTTLLNALTFRTKRSTTVSGVIRVNGMAAGAGSIVALSAYVTQHDLFTPNLTVREHLQFQAAVRMGSATTSTEDKMARVEEVVAEVRRRLFIFFFPPNVDERPRPSLVPRTAGPRQVCRHSHRRAWRQLRHLGRRAPEACLRIRGE